MSTVLVCKSENGVLLAGDGRIVGHTTILSEKSNKIVELKDYYIGSVGLLSLILKIEKDILKDFKGHPIELIYKIQDRLSGLEEGDEVAFLIFHKKDKKLYYVDLHVYFPIERDFFAIGSGRPFALGYLEALYSPRETIEDLEKVIKGAMKVASKYDAGTGGEIKIIKYV